jgi:lincosamide nucleotidyltransferase A/C/D/E
VSAKSSKVKLTPMMTAGDVLRLLDSLTDACIAVWVDGGWGVDALLGVETRQHDDLDIALRLSDVEHALQVLDQLGFRIHHDELPTRADLRAADDRRVDLHPLSFDKDGNGLQQLQDGSLAVYDKQGLSGRGVIAGKQVKCLSPETQLRFHSGYRPDDSDRQDVRLLADRFGLELPPDYHS